MVDSLIPVLLVTSGGLEQAVRTSVNILEQSIESFEMSARRLVGEQYPSSLDALKVVEFIRNCQHMCTGNLYWR